MTTLTIAKTGTFHTKFRGDTTGETIQKKLEKHDSNRIFNRDLNIRLQTLKTSDLVPLDSQRFTKEKWVVDRLTDLEGLDMWAFGALDVCYDERDDTYYVWNGCGRWALATAAGLDQVPCLIIDGKKEQAAFYFAYAQERGRRTLSKEVLFVNRFYAGEEQALKEAQLLNQLGLYVQGDTDYSVPHPATPGHINIGYRAFSEGIKIAADDINLCRQARDMIAIAWSNSPTGCTVINQDIYWAVIKLMQIYPNARKNGLNQALQHYLTGVASQRDQSKVRWKPKGLSANSGVAPLLAFGLYKDFRESHHWKASFGNQMPLNVIQALIQDEA